MMILSETLAGPRSVRNRIGHGINLVDYLNLGTVRPDHHGDGHITGAYQEDGEGSAVTSSG